MRQKKNSRDLTECSFSHFLLPDSLFCFNATAQSIFQGYLLPWSRVTTY